MKEEGSNRRLFLKRVAGGGACLILGASPFTHVLAARTYGVLPLPGTVSDKSEKDRVVFPFLKYIEPFNIGEFIPKDQGGMFVQMELLGTEEDAAIVQKIKGGLLERIYGDPIEWGALEKTALEKSVWLNRFYYLPSFARLYYLHNDEQALAFMMQFIRRWIAENPRQGNSGNSKYNWYDMQVAWRAIHLSWCYFLCQQGLSKSDKELIYNSLEEHAELLLSGFGTQALNDFNHQSHGALAMLYLGVLFPGLEQADQLKTSAMRILNHHLEHAFYADGGNTEHMFGYYPFQTHMFRDMYLLCTNNNVAVPNNLLPMLLKMEKYLYLVAQPDDTMPPVNDSYPMVVAPILSTLYDISGGQTLTSKKSHYFPDSQFGVIHVKDTDSSWYLLANPAMRIGTHAHAGRLSFVLWFNKQPLLIDSGCCNYDNPRLVDWYRISRAHNTVLIDGKSDEATSTDRLWAPKRITDNRITDWVEEGPFTHCRMLSPETEEVNNGVSWNRDLAIVKNKYVIIHDCFLSSDEHRYEALLHFPPEKVTLHENKTIRLQGAEKVDFIPADKEMIDKVVLEKGLVSVKGEGVKAPMATYRFGGSGTTHFVLICVPVSARSSSIKIKQINTPDGTALKIVGEDKEKTVLLMRNPASDRISAFGYTTTKMFDVF